jgi:hypothetical protein
MELGVVHDARLGADLNPAGARREIDALIEVRPSPEPNVPRVPKPNVALDAGRTVHVEDEPIEEAA